MNNADLIVREEDVCRLLSAANADAALLYIYTHCGNHVRDAGRELNMTDSRLQCAAAALRQLDLLPREEGHKTPVGERPNYTEADVISATESDHDFRMLKGEVQRILGKPLTVEEQKILLGFTRYLGLPEDVISILIQYCRERARRRGASRAPSLRTIEKEAYIWAEQGIDTMEAASAYVQSRLQHMTKLGRLQQLLQIRGRPLTPAEERYAEDWIGRGFDEEALTMAYEKTCLNTGGLNWKYMNGILNRWHEAGLHTGKQVLQGDRKVPAGGSRELDADELEAIRRMMREG